MNPRVLVVEDEPAILLAIARTLEAARYDVLALRSGAAARQALDRGSIDLAILDVNLPDCTGWDVVRHIRASRDATTPVVVISAVSPRVAQLRQHDIAGVLQKPFPMESLVRLAARLATREPLVNAQ